MRSNLKLEKVKKDSEIPLYFVRFPVPKKNMDRFAMFHFEGDCIALMNGYFDIQMET